MLRLEAYTLSNRGRSLRIADSQSAGWKPVPKHINYSVGYWLPASCEGLIANRRQMLAHFPTVTQSTGFQPEPLLTTHCSLLIAHSPSLTPHRSLLITHNALHHNTHLTSSLNPHSLLLRIILFSPSLRLCFPFDDKAKFYRRQSEVLSKTYRTSIEDLSKRACGNILIPHQLWFVSCDKFIKSRLDTNFIHI